MVDFDAHVLVRLEEKVDLHSVREVRVEVVEDHFGLAKQLPVPRYLLIDLDVGIGERHDVQVDQSPAAKGQHYLVLRRIHYIENYRITNLHR